MPLPHTRVIPDGWSAHHQPVSESAMRTTVSILLPVAEIPTPGWGEDPQEADPVLVADVSARLRALSSRDALAPSDQTLDTQDYLVQVPAALLPTLRVGEAGHRLRVEFNPEQPFLEGRTLSLRAIMGGTEAFNRDLLCRDHVTQNQ